jgi:hypothetical protein
MPTPVVADYVTVPCLLLEAKKIGDIGGRHVLCGRYRIPPHRSTKDELVAAEQVPTQTAASLSKYLT